MPSSYKTYSTYIFDEACRPEKNSELRLYTNLSAFPDSQTRLKHRSSLIYPYPSCEALLPLLLIRLERGHPSWWPIFCQNNWAYADWIQRTSQSQQSTISSPPITQPVWAMQLPLPTVGVLSASPSMPHVSPSGAALHHHHPQVSISALFSAIFWVPH